jgi:hypothetical protein
MRRASRLRSRTIERRSNGRASQRWPGGRDAPIGEDILRDAEDYGLCV